MDKVKLVLAQLKKHHFWVLCGLIVVTALLSWAQATADLAGRTEKRMKALEGEFASVLHVNSEPNHPNEAVIKAVRDAIDGTDKPGVKQNVLKAWDILYQEQKKKNALPDVLGTQFKKHWEDRPAPAELDPDDLDTYMYQIEKYFPKLFDMIDLRRPRHSGPVTAAHAPPAAHNPAGKDDKTDMVGTVEWDDANREELLKRFHWDNRPDSKEVRLAQEDLWVYEALLRIIKDTNEGTTYDTAAIRKIDALEIGRPAVESWRQAEETVFHLGGASGPGGKGAKVIGGRPGGMLPSRGMTFQKPSPLADRYVDDKGKPLSDETKQPYAEFKMMPIDLRLVIHQKKITRLLAHCANSNMPIQVRTVRLRPNEGEALNLEAMAGATTGPAIGGPGGGGLVPGAHPAQHGEAHDRDHPGTGNAPDEEATDSNYIPIEVQGIIYIYNPPNMNQLGTGLAVGGSAAGTAPPAASPAPAPAAIPPKTPPMRGPAAGVAAPPGPPGAGSRREAMKLKMKVKLDKATLQQFFIDNGEKIIFAVVAVCSLAMLYGALTQNGYTKHPIQLIENSNSAEQHVEGTPVGEWKGWKDCNSPDFWKLVEKSKDQIDEDVYAWSVLLYKPVVKQLKSRPKPELYAAQKLQGTAGAGAFASSHQGAGQTRDQQGMRYVVFTALVPWEQQKTAYQEAFHEAAWQNHLTDEQPQYGGFYVQRAPVTESPGQNPQWETIANSWTIIRDLKKQWSKFDPEVVDQKYIIGRNEKNGGNQPHEDNSPLVVPLGPLTHGIWGAEVAHKPEIPPMSKTKPADIAPAVRTEEPGNRGDGPDFVDKEPPPQHQSQPAPEEEKEQPSKYLLLRFFDFSVKSGTMYRYRVQLVLRNPNHGVELRYLTDPESNKSQAIESPWSEPTGVIAVPPDVRILAGAVTFTRQGEPEGKVTVMQWIENSGTTIYHEFANIIRGQNLDFIYAVRNTTPGLDRRTHYTKVNYTTGAIAVDLTGGDGLAGEILVLDQNGKLVAHNNIDDEETFQQWENQETATGDRHVPPDNHGRPQITPRKLDDIPSTKAPPSRPPKRT